MTKAITPEDVGSYKTGSFPQEVFEAFNELIAENYSNGYSTVSQEKVVKLIQEKLGYYVKFKYGWLNVEDVYEDAGWIVEYDKPGYNESYGASFKFRG